MKTIDEEVISTLADEAENLGKIYKSAPSLLRAIRRHILEKFTDATDSELDNIEGQVLKVVYERKAQHAPPPRPSVVRGESSMTSRRKSNRGRYSGRDLAAGAETEDRRDEIQREFADAEPGAA